MLVIPVVYSFRKDKSHQLTNDYLEPGIWVLTRAGHEGTFRISD